MANVEEGESVAGRVKWREEAAGEGDRGRKKKIRSCLFLLYITRIHSSLHSPLWFLTSSLLHSLFLPFLSSFCSFPFLPSFFPSAIVHFSPSFSPLIQLLYILSSLLAVLSLPLLFSLLSSLVPFTLPFVFLSLSSLALPTHSQISPNR